MNSKGINLISGIKGFRPSAVVDARKMYDGKEVHDVAAQKIVCAGKNAELVSLGYKPVCKPVVMERRGKRGKRKSRLQLWHEERIARPSAACRDDKHYGCYKRNCTCECHGGEE